MTPSTPGTGAIDLGRFNQAFFEECAEHLTEMERILVSLGDREPVQEELNAIFRAAHSIKGGAGIFGFEEMTVVTHVMESLLDRLRNRQIPFDPALVDLFLEAGDVISLQLAGHSEGKEVPPGAVERVSRRLREFMEEPSLERSRAAPETEAEGGASACRYRLSFEPDPEIFTRGIRVQGIIRELAGLAAPGEFRCRAWLRELPELEGFDAERCITRWEFDLLSEATREQIAEVFMFVADEEQLRIRTEPPSPPPAEGSPKGLAPGPTPPPPPEAQPLYHLPKAPAKPEERGGESDSSIRVSVAKVDQLVNQVGELLITQAMLAQIVGSLDPVLHQALQQSMEQLERNTRDLQQSVMSIRLVPIGLVFSRFPRMVRQIAARLGKQVQFRTVGDGTELDKGLVEKIADPLSHLVRNALDHGLEPPETRRARGKEPAGVLQLKASQVGGRVVVEVMDDGAGLDRARILAKAVERRIPCSTAMSDEEVWQLVFAPGFSTAETVTDISGRGVGMDVVLKNVQAVGGRVQISSEPGRGTRVGISLPLTLAILEGLSVAVGGEKFVIPVNVVVESLQPQAGALKRVNGNELLQVRGEYLPIVRLQRLFGLEGATLEPERGILVLVQAEGERAALLVDALLDEQQVVVKSMETNYRKVEGSAGATILGDGRVALILEVTELLAMQKRVAR